MTQTIEKYKVSESGVIHSINDSDLELSFMNRGIMKGASFKLVSKVPFKGPIVLDVEGEIVSIRYSDAINILTETLV